MSKQVDNQQIKASYPDVELARQLFGEHNSNLKRIATALGIQVHARGNSLYVQGDAIDTKLAKTVLDQLYQLLKEGYPIYENDVDYAIRVLSENDRADLRTIFMDTVYVTSKDRTITPKSRAQKEYIDAIRNHDIVFGIGPAGTGKTYLAMAMAVSALFATAIWCLAWYDAFWKG